MLKVGRAVILACAVGAVLAPRASADPLLPGQVLRVDFDFATAAPFPPNFGVPDMLWGEFTATRQAPFGTFTAQLFNGSELLGTYRTSVNGDTSVGGLRFLSVFLAPGTAFDLGVFGPAGTADFSSVRNRSLDGRFEFSITSGLIDVNLNSADVLLWHVLPNGTAVGNVSSHPRITNVAIVDSAPEPASLLLFGSGAAFAAWRSRARLRGRGPIIAR